MLVDRHRGEVVAHRDPEGGRYRHSQKAVFGAKLRLPEPFGFDLDTSDLDTSDLDTSDLDTSDPDTSDPA